MSDATPQGPRDGIGLDPATLVRVGLAHHREGRLNDAAGCYETALLQAPDHAEAMHLLGLLRVAQGRAEDGIALLRRAAAATPGLPAVWYNLGVALRAQNQHDEAAECLRRAVALDPNYGQAHLALGAAARVAGRLDEAVDCYRRALDAGPPDAALLLAVGIEYGQAGRLEDAAACFRQAAELAPGVADAHSNLGTALERLGRPEDAAESFRRALELRPNDAAAHYRLGVALGEQNRLTEAIACYRASLALRPDDARTRFNLAVLLLRRGDFVAGLPEYECRWQTGVLTPSPHAAARPQWRGEAVSPGTTILLHAEQGFGDTLQFVRYAPLLAARGARVLLEVQPGLETLLAGLPGTAGVFAQGDTPPAFDLQCPMMSLPLAFGTRIETIPPPVPMTVPADRLAAWTALSRSDGMRRVGIAWSGNPEQPSDRGRSMTLALFRRILEAPNCRFHLLQPELRAADEAAFSQIHNLIDFRGWINSFADTAAMISHMDLVITTDTAVAHLAGAMSRPVWVLLSATPDWRWLLGRDDSPWYPTARLFRQDRRGDWSGVIDRVREALSR